jgi:hypothetical protein
VDSGSTVTVIRDQSLFTKLMPTTINVADISGESQKAIGTGQVKVVINTTRGPQMITIQDCVCIPGFAADILSTQRMRRIDGYTFTLPAGHNGYMVSSELEARKVPVSKEKPFQIEWISTCRIEAQHPA